MAEGVSLEAMLMVEELRHAAERAKHQPEGMQRRIAALIEEELEEREWDDLVGIPECQRFLSELTEAARQENSNWRIDENAVPMLPLGTIQCRRE